MIGPGWAASSNREIHARIPTSGRQISAIVAMALSIEATKPAVAPSTRAASPFGVPAPMADRSTRPRLKAAAC